ncbi:MAM domain-containing glycosylphosphatidylinositol anchor protein 2 [Denticeps clupeoides]|uniref:MAM domain-containing glycosylphosphatidylinositol anchor protein 2 n=1 Tax=Denticeps clupeoides TaxID=299321 RepID=A0AAY4BVY5_9TELE|nr:MAM domain-containing glycosylphosphatidylinositol anchor protein 2 [Denticeps clupeoides]XP_028832590.1 MAM domain-containing glycosylphosphatidylinositol anchor protein 2 [Denticeps clupeoides]
MDLVFGLLWLLILVLEGVHCQGVYASPSVRIIHLGHACNVEEERYTERVYTIREGETLELTCLVTGHPRPQIRWTKTAGSASDRFQDSSVFNETLRISQIQRHQGGRYYCKAENGLGSPAIKSIRVDVYYLDDPIITVHQSIGEAKEQFYYERTVFLRCAANSNPPVRYSWRRGREFLSQGSDKGVEIYEPFFTQGETKILKLKNLRPQDYANYTCIASVRNVCGIPDKSVLFRLTNRTASPTIKLLVEDPIVANPGQTVTLVCITSGGEPTPTLTWVRNAEGLPKNSVLKGGTLTLRSITVEDSGVFSCVASNNVGNPAKKSTNIIVRALKKGRFWITPDPYHNDDNIQIGREVKISCQVEAMPPEELQFSWLKNGRPLRSSERMVITQTDPDVAPGTTNLDIIDLKFTDFGTYTCMASLKNGGIQEISIDVNISSTTVPPNLTVPRGKSPLVTQEGDTVDLQCLVSGKPKPIILWSRADKEAPMPDGSMQTESYDGVLRFVNVSREMSGSYRCQTSQYNGFNVKPREAIIELIVQYPPVVEPVYTEIRQALGRAFSLTCSVLRAHPSRVLKYEWKLGTRLLTVGQFDTRDETEYHVRALNREGFGEYTCDITNEAGAGRCTFLVTGKAYPPEFYYDTYTALWQNKPRVYGFKLQWTQMNPNAVDRIMAYRLGIKQTGQQRWWEQDITMDGVIQKGELITYNLTELIKPESYQVRLTPITRLGEGDSAERIIRYSAPVNPHWSKFHCSFDDEAICMFTQEKTDNFDWTRHSAATRDTKYTPNTGPSSDFAGSKQGFYMYIETSRPRVEGDKAQLLSPSFNVAPKNPYGTVTANPTYCFSFYYHMYGKHIGMLNIYLRQKGQTGPDSSIWTLKGNQGDRWKQAKVNIHPTSSFQIVLEGVRGPGIEGDIAIDNVDIEEGECQNPPPNSNLMSSALPVSKHIWPLCLTMLLVLFSCRR